MDIIEASERIANFLHRYRKMYYWLWVVAFIALGGFALNGFNVSFAFVLAALWLAGIGFAVGGLRRSARIAEAKKLRGYGQEVVYKFVTSRAYDYFIVLFSIFWFSFLTYVTIRLAMT